jgi:hypothetical protein
MVWKALSPPLSPPMSHLFCFSQISQASRVYSVHHSEEGQHPWPRAARSEPRRTVFWKRPECVCASHHRWNSAEHKRAEIGNKKLNGQAGCCSHPPQRVPELSKVHRWIHLRKMAPPKNQHGSHINCQSRGENTEAITHRRKQWSPACEGCSLSCSTQLQTHAGEKSAPQSGHSAKSPLSQCTPSIAHWPCVPFQATPRSLGEVRRLISLLTQLSGFRNLRELIMGK